ncbi:acyltransferase family protein [Amycolatopsis sp. NPDC059657]|uniref:acyltransferase family protein n=1 Tax=Amycolatopsis sp. NPDC059657 TaxID=3346899 RepID=UPI003672A3AD
MANSPKPTARRLSWDVIRVVAVLSVVLGHITHQSKIMHPELAGYPFTVPVQFGATILLVISAFFMCATLRKDKPGRWLLKKVSRVLPGYLVAVLITYVMMRIAAAAFSGQQLHSGFTGFMFDPAIGAPTTDSPWYLPNGLDLYSNIFMIQSWSTDFNYLDGSYWTLPVQIMAFTAAALLFPRKWRTDKTMVVLIWAMLAVPLAIRFVIFTPTDTPSWAVTMIFGLGLHRVHAFAIGIAIYLWTKNRLKTWHLAAFLTASVVAQDLHMFPLHYATAIDPERLPSVAGFAVMLLAMCAAAKGPDWTWFRPLARPIKWLAGISFGLYLVHQELGYMLARALRDLGATPWERLVLVLAAAIVAGWLLTVLVERPAYRLLTREHKAAPLALPHPSPPVDDLVEGHAKTASPISVGGPS